MNELFESLGNQLKGTSAGVKIIAFLVLVALIVVIAGGTVAFNKPDFQQAFSGLTDHEFPKVTKALADAGLAFRTTQPPGPFTVFVNEGDRSAAYQAVYGAGALDKPLRGILTDGGMASVFASSEERKQGVRKREWGEIEKMLEVLDFVHSAVVRTSQPSDSPMAAHTASPRTASVTLRVINNALLESSQQETVANLVSRGLGISKENIVISDQFGKNLYDGGQTGKDDMRVKDLLAHQDRYDARLTEVANVILRDVLGPRKAKVTVRSEWDYAQSTIHREEAVGQGAIVSETKTKTDRRIPAGSPEAVGISANTLNPAATNPVEPVSPDPAEPLTENTTDEKREYVPTITREDKVDYVPRLTRLSVALFLDKSLETEEVDTAGIEAAIKASVGFSEERDKFSSVIHAFAGNEVAEGEGGAAEPIPSAPNPLIDKLLKHGLEIGTGMIFVILLLRSMKKSNVKEATKGSAEAKGKATSEDASADEEAAEEEEALDPEALTRKQVEEMIEQDPTQLSEALTQWILEDEPVEAGR